MWDPHDLNDSQVDKVESVQSKAARFACSNWRRTASVSEMKARLNWETLQERRARSRVMMLHKVYHSLVAIPLHHFPLCSSTLSTPLDVQTRSAPAVKFVVHMSLVPSRTAELL